MKWPKIHSYVNMRENTADCTPVDRWVAKVKLHGTFGAVVVDGDQPLLVFSRNRELKPDADNYGFYKFVYDNCLGFGPSHKLDRLIAAQAEIRATQIPLNSLIKSCRSYAAGWFKARAQ